MHNLVGHDIGNGYLSTNEEANLDERGKVLYIDIQGQADSGRRIFATLSITHPHHTPLMISVACKNINLQKKS